MKYQNIFALLFMIISSSMFSEIILQHQNPLVVTSDTVLKLEIIEGFNDIDHVEFHFRVKGDVVYNRIEMITGSEAVPIFSVKVPTPKRIDLRMEYFFIVYDNAGNTQTLPQVQPNLTPYNLAFEQPEIYRKEFVRLSPEGKIFYFEEEIVIAISTFALEGKIDKSTLKFFLNDKDRTTEADVSKNLIVFKIKNAKIGNLNYQIKVKHLDGRELASKLWAIQVLNRKPFSLPLDTKGEISLNSTINNISYEESQADTIDLEKRANLTFKLRGEKDWFSYHSRVFLSDEEDKYKQPVNRYNFSLKIPHFTFSVGDVSPRFDSFSINNTNIRGFYSTYSTKYFRLKTVYGRSKRAIEKGIGESENSFRRNSFGIRTEIGNEKNFQFGFSINKNKDDLSSINRSFYKDENNGDRMAAKDNIVLESDFSFKAFQNRLMLGTEISTSLLNNNINDGIITKEEFEDDYGSNLPFDPKKFESILIINENIQPFKLGRGNLAFRVFMRTMFKQNFFNISYSEIGTSYNALATSSLKQDERKISINDNMYLWKNRIILGLGINYSYDNISSQKESTTGTANYNINFVIRPDYLPVWNFNFSKTASSNDASKNPIDQTTGTFSTGISYKVMNIPFSPTTFTLRYNLFDYSDNTSSNKLKRNTLSLNSKSEFQSLPLVISGNYSFSKNDYKMVKDQMSDFTSFGLKADFVLFEKKMKPFISLKLSTFDGDIDQQFVQHYAIGTGYNILTNTYISCDFSLKTYSNNDNNIENFRRTAGKVRIVQKF